MKVKCHHSASCGQIRMARVGNKWVQGPFPLSLLNVGVDRVKDACSLSLWIISERQDCLRHQWLFHRGTSWEKSSLEMATCVHCCFSNDWIKSTYFASLVCFAVKYGKVLHNCLWHIFTAEFSELSFITESEASHHKKEGHSSSLFPQRHFSRHKLKLTLQAEVIFEGHKN